MDNPQINPLSKFFRQPKLWLNLPSSGSFYPAGSLIKTENGEYPVLAMTAKDEITIKTPDALMNGQATVDLIQSCVPNIKNAWNVPSIDIDAILIAIRIASFGNDIDIDLTIPNTDITRTYTTDLSNSLTSIMNAAFDSTVELDNGFTIEVRPLTYREFTQNAIKTLEEQRIVSVLNSSELSDSDKLVRFNASFKTLTDININMVTTAITSITTPDGTKVVKPEFIKEFIDNADSDFYVKVIKHLEIQRDKFKMPNLKVITTAEERKEGAPDEFETPMTLDFSHFFERGSSQSRT